MPGGKLPGGVKLTGSPYGQWAGPNIADKNNELDVWALGTDGALYHWWFKVSANRWEGPEVFG